MPTPAVPLGVTEQTGGSVRPVRIGIIGRDSSLLRHALDLARALADAGLEVLHEHVVDTVQVRVPGQADAVLAHRPQWRDPIPGTPWAVLAQLETMVQQLPDQSLRQPELTVWFDLDPAVAAERLASARVPDKFEAQPTAFFAAVRAGYARRAQAAPQRFARIDAAASREAVAQQVHTVLAPWVEARA